MKKLITVLLAAALIWSIQQNTPVKNLESQAAHTKQTGQSESKLTEKVVAKVEQPKAQPAETQPEPQVIAEPLSDKELLMQEAGIPQSEWEATDYIVSHESSWNPSAVNASSGATGLCQALPASKMASVGGDFLTNPVTQLKWCHEYANSRYGNWWGSFAFWKANRWW